MTTKPNTNNRTTGVLGWMLSVVSDVINKIYPRAKEHRGAQRDGRPYHERQEYIFPPGFARLDDTSGRYFQTSPGTLYTVLIDFKQPKDHLEYIVVRSASYCKQPKASKHEFIVLEVEDTHQSTPGLINYLILDCNDGDSNNTGGIFPFASVQTSATMSSVTSARDEFRISYDGDREELLNQCGLKKHTVLERLVFDDSNELHLYHLVILASKVSARKVQYHLIDANRFWFAGLIWAGMLQMRPKVKRNSIQSALQETFGSWLRQVQDNDEVVETVKKAEYMSNEVDTKFKDSLEVRELERRVNQRQIDIQKRRQNSMLKSPS